MASISSTKTSFYPSEGTVTITSGFYTSYTPTRTPYTSSRYSRASELDSILSWATSLPSYTPVSSYSSSSSTSGFDIENKKHRYILFSLISFACAVMLSTILILNDRKRKRLAAMEKDKAEAAAASTAGSSEIPGNLNGAISGSSLPEMVDPTTPPPSYSSIRNNNEGSAHASETATGFVREAGNNGVVAPAAAHVPAASDLPVYEAPDWRKRRI
jgi:hypothetical protein